MPSCLTIWEHLFWLEFHSSWGEKVGLENQLRKVIDASKWKENEIFWKVNFTAHMKRKEMEKKRTKLSTTTQQENHEK